MKTVRSLLLVSAMAVALAGCASTGATSSPATTVYQVESGYKTALVAAVAYKKLPVCKEPRQLPCSDPAVVAQLQRADNVANAAIAAAESATRTPGFGKDAIASALGAANAALTALTAIVAQFAK